MLSYRWPHVAYTARGVRQLNRQACLTHCAVAWIVNIYHHVARPDVGILERFLDRVDWTHADIFVLKEGKPVVTSFLTQNVLDFLLGPCGGAIRHTGRSVHCAAQMRVKSSRPMAWQKFSQSQGSVQPTDSNWPSAVS